MKKKMLSAALVLFMGLGMANTALASEKTMCHAIAQAQDEVSYTEITAEELPEVISEALQDSSYADYSISKAFVGSDASYKVLLSKEGAATIEVIFNAEGEIVKSEEIVEA